MLRFMVERVQGGSFAQGAFLPVGRATVSKSTHDGEKGIPIGFFQESNNRVHE